MRPSVLVFALIIGVLTAGAVFADCAVGSGAGPSVQTAPAPSMQHPMMRDNVQSMTVDDRYIYIVRDNELLKLRKTDLSLVARTSISPEDIARIGRGPVVERGTPLYPSGSYSDLYEPSGDIDTRMFRGYEYLVDE